MSRPLTYKGFEIKQGFISGEIRINQIGDTKQLLFASIEAAKLYINGFCDGAFWADKERGELDENNKY